MLAIRSDRSMLRGSGSGQMVTPRRRMVDRIMTAQLALVTAATMAVLLWILGYVALQGWRFLGPEFFTKTPPGNPANAGGGFVNGIVGSLEIVGLATILAVPAALATSVYIVEYGGQFARTVSFVTDVLVGLPTIVIGAFVYTVVVTRSGFSGIAGAIALSLVMLPLVTRSTAEMLRQVPRELREAGLALGLSPARTISSIVLPTARSGIVTGIMLAVARAMGESAPLLLTTLGNELFVELDPGERMSTLALQIFTNAATGYRNAQGRAWAGALTLVAMVLTLTVAAHALRQRRSTGGR
jgi:phosphate transport system permease protein